MTFNPLDWAILLAYLAAMTAIGGMSYRRKADSKDFFLAGRSAAWLPVAISIIATDFSAITYLGLPAFVYQRDLQQVALYPVLILVVIPIVIRYLVPFYSRLNLFTAYEYLEKRYDGRVRTMASLLFLLMRGIYMGIVIYAPSLVISVVTGLPLHLSIIMMGVLTTIYTALGGMRAVIWTDFAQFLVIMAGLAAIITTAYANIDGGWSTILATSADLGKLKVVDFAPDPNREFTFWAVAIGSFFMFLNTYGTDQVILQRYLTTRSVKECQKALKLEAVLLIPTVGILAATGLILAVYYFQHPGEAEGIVLRDAVLPYFTVQHLPVGLRGLVIASIFAAAMSTVSGGINSLTTASVVDFYRRLLRRQADESHYVAVSRLITVMWGVLATAIALFAGLLGELANAYNKVNSHLGGVVLGIFLLGMLTRRATAGSALAGAGIGLATVFTLSSLTQVSWLWYGCVGCCSTFLSGGLLGGSRRRQSAR
jgi:SSS family transporter